MIKYNDENLIKEGKDIIKKFQMYLAKKHILITKI